MSSEPETIGQRLRRLRRERGLSQRDIAAPGVSFAYISRIEQGERVPSVRAIRALARNLGVAPEYLETGSELSEAAQREWRLSEAELGLRIADDPSEAEQAFVALEREARDAGDLAAMTRAQIGLGLAAAQRGAHRDSIRHLESVVASGRVSPATHPDVFATLARSYATAGSEAKAVDLFERCRAELRERLPKERAAYIRFATYLSYALSDLGDVQRARGVLEDAFEHLDEASDPYSRVRLYWSQARLAEIEGQHAIAQSSIRRAIALLELTDDTIHLGRAHLLYAESMLAEGRASEALERLERAAFLLGGQSDSKDRTWLLVLKAQAALATEEIADAEQLAREAIQAAGDDDGQLRGGAETVLGRAAAARNDVEGAIRAFERAERLLDGGDRRHLVELLEHWSSVLEQAGRLEEALAVVRRASRVASQRSVREPAPSGGPR